MTVFIYALLDPATKTIRYLGKAADPHARFVKHFEELSRYKTHKTDWIKSLLKQERVPILEVLDAVPESEWQFWEQEYIRWGRVMQLRLTNGTEGGEGWKKGARHKPETLVKMSVSQKGKKLSPEHRAALSASHAGETRRPLSPETKAKIGAANRGRIRSLESRAKMRASRMRFLEQHESTKP